MRALLLGACLGLVSTGAFAACTCACVEGQAVSACSSPTDMAIVCQRICLPSVLPPGSPKPAINLGESADSFQERGNRREIFIGSQEAR